MRTSATHARFRFLTRALAGAALSAGLVASAAIPAQAASPSGTVSFGGAGASAPALTPGTDPYNLLNTAKSYSGTPYRWGGTSPSGWDCSGLTQYVLGSHGMHYPRTTNQQLAATRTVAAGDQRPGDLVFFMSGSNAYHVGIYAGNGWMVDAGRSGKATSLRKMWASPVVYTRVLI